MKINVKKTKAMKISKRPGEELLFFCTEDDRGIYEEYMYETSKLITHSGSVLSHFVIRKLSHFVMKYRKILSISPSK